MNHPALTEAELDQYEGFAASPTTEDYVMDASTLQGLAAALAIGPRVISPAIRLPWVWDMHRGQRPPALATMDEANTVMVLVMRQYNAVVAAFESPDASALQPLFRRGAQWGAAEFCQGLLIGDALHSIYGRAVASVGDGDLRPVQALIGDPKVSMWMRFSLLDAWRVRVMEGDAEAGHFERYLLDLGQRSAGRLRRGEREPERAEILDDVAAEITWWDSYTEPAPRASAPPPATTTVCSGPKIGRDDPCPCGSGRK